jgi:uncharacterized protein YqeY
MLFPHVCNCVQLALIESYLPAMMSASEVEAVVAAAVAETGASSVKDMGKVMGLVKVCACQQ